MAITYITHCNWSVQKEIYPLFKFVLPMFEGIFGVDVMSKEMCSVYVDMNCPTAPVITFNPTRIILRAEPCYWCQVVYQLSHELTHYAVRQNTNYQYTNCAIAAFEEPACEAMAIYICKLCSEQWENCKYSSCNKDWGANFEKYRESLYNDASGSTQCDTYQEWTSLCSAYTGSLTSVSQRPEQSAMRNHLYDSFIQMPDMISEFIEYPLHIRSIPYEKLIDSSAWAAQSPDSEKLIRAICSIQPQVP
jgi:hypothetical protein